MITPQTLLGNPAAEMHPFSAQTMRDHASLAGRIQELGPEYQEVRRRLQGKLKRDLSDAAAVFIKKYRLPSMERVERRTLEGVVSWFCKYNVLSLLDSEDERKLGINRLESQNPLEGNAATVKEDEDDLFAPSKDDPSRMNDEKDGMKLIESIFGE
jgi:hypothetical protein